MKNQIYTSKHIPTVLITVFIAMVLFTVAQLYNLFHSLSSGFPYLAIVWLALFAFIGILFYSFINRAVSRNRALEEQLDKLKASLNAALTANKDEVQEEHGESLDIERELNSIIPTIDADNTEAYGEALLAAIAKKFDIVQGTLFLKNPEGVFSFKAGYAFFSETDPPTYSEGETLPGQVAKNRQLLNLKKVPKGYITILSGLGKGNPSHLLIVPVITPDNQVTGIIELASFKAFDEEHETLFARLGQKLGTDVFNNV